MTDPINDLVSQIETTIWKLRNGTSKQDRDDLEFDLNDLNISISWMEYDRDCSSITLWKDRDKEYQDTKAEIKTDAAMKRHLESKFLERQSVLDTTEATLKKLKRLHQGFIRVAEHIKWGVIQENVDKKRNDF